MKAQAQRGEIVLRSRREDIFARAFKKPEHGGRVRGVGSGITNRDYFGTNTQTSSDLHAQIQNLQSQVNVMMSFIMSGMSQGQTRPMWTSSSSGFTGGCNGLGNGDIGHEIAREENGNGSFMNLLFGGDGGQLRNGNRSEQENSDFQANSGNKEPETYRVPWPNSANLHQREKELHFGEKCSPRELEKSAAHTTEIEMTGYDTQPLSNHNLPQVPIKL